MQAQAGKIIHAQTAIGLHRPMLELNEKLANIMPHPSLDTFFYCTVGAEAVENAVKTARMYTGRNNLIVMNVRVWGEFVFLADSFSHTRTRSTGGRTAQ